MYASSLDEVLEKRNHLKKQSLYNTVFTNMNTTLQPIQIFKLITNGPQFIDTQQEKKLSDMFFEDKQAQSFLQKFHIMYTEGKKDFLTYVVYDKEQKILQNLTIYECQPEYITARQILRQLSINRILSQEKYILPIEQCFVSGQLGQLINKNPIRVITTTQIMQKNLNDFLKDMIHQFKLDRTQENQIKDRNNKIFNKIEYIIYQLLNILWLLESSHILHRNISLSNIFIDKDNNIKLSGFELARDFNKNILYQDVQKYKCDSETNQTKNNLFGPKKTEEPLQKIQKILHSFKLKLKPVAESLLKQEQFDSNQKTNLTYPLENLQLQSNSIMSPESLLGLQYDYRVDSWSIGWIIFQIFNAYYEEEILITGKFGSKYEQLQWILTFFGQDYFNINSKSFDFIGLNIKIYKYLGENQYFDLLFFANIPENGRYLQVLNKFQTKYRAITQMLLCFNPYLRCFGTQIIENQNDSVDSIAVKLPYELQMDDLDTLQFLHYEELLYRKKWQFRDKERETYLQESTIYIDEIMEKCC